MSTLKKLFALTLAVVMVLSVSAFAGFSDVSAINEDCREDVELLVALNVINGMGDGTFAPNGTITRAQAAKMIYVLRNKGVDDGAAIWKGTSQFKDVPSGAWYEGYVNYCADYGIVTGRTTTVFDPNAPVTGVELAKMLLVVAGYKANVQGYVGATWASKVRTDAENAGLLADYAFSFAQPAPRQWACKMFVNTLGASVASYVGDYLVTPGTMGGAITTVAQKYLDLANTVDFVTANDNWGLGVDKADEGKATLTTLGTVDFNVADELVGKTVVVASNAVTGKIYGISESKDNTFGALSISRSGSSATAGSSSEYAYTVKFGTKSFAAVKHSVASAGPTAAFDNGCVFYSVDLDAVCRPAFVVASTPLSALYSMLSSTKDYTASYTAFDTDGNGKINYVLLTACAFGTVKADPTSTAITITFSSPGVDHSYVLGGTSKVTLKDTLKAGDVVKVALNVYTGAVEISKVTPEIGMFTKIAGSNFTVGGTAYSKASEFVGTDMFVSGNLGKTLEVYTDGKYAVYTKEYTPDSGSTSTTLTSSICYTIAGAAVAKPDDFGMPSSEYTYKVKVLFANGTQAVVEYDSSSDLNTTKYYAVADLFSGSNFAAADQVFEYSMNNGQIAFKRAFTPTTGVDFTASTENFNYDKQRLGSMLTSAKSYVFVRYTADSKIQYKVMKFADFKSAADGVAFDVLAKTDAAIATALVAVKDFGSANLPGAAFSTTDTNVMVVADVYTEFDAEANASFAFASAADIKTGATKPYKFALGTTLTKWNLYTLASKSDGTYTATLIAPTTISARPTTAGWYKGAIVAKADDVLLINGVLFDGDDFATDVKVTIRNASTSVTASKLSALVLATETATDSGIYNENIVFYFNGTKIDNVIFMSSGAKVTANAGTYTNP